MGTTIIGIGPVLSERAAGKTGCNAVIWGNFMSTKSCCFCYWPACYFKCL